MSSRFNYVNGSEGDTQPILTNLKYGNIFTQVGHVINGNLMRAWRVGAAV